MTILYWDDAADIGAVNTVEITYNGGQDTYHVRNLRVVVDGGSADYGSYPEGFPYTAAAALDGISSILGQAYDGGGDGNQYSMETGAGVGGLSFLTWFWPHIAGTTVTLYWDHAADINVGNADTSTGQVRVNGTSVGTFTTPAASVGWGSASVDISAQWNAAGPAGHTSTADIYVNGVDVGDFTTLAASVGWQSRSLDITAQWTGGSDDEIKVRYKAGNDTYHVRNLRVEVEGGSPDYGEFPNDFPYTVGAAAGSAVHLGQAYDGASNPRQWSMQTNTYVIGTTYMEWFFHSITAGWRVGAVAW